MALLCASGPGFAHHSFQQHYGVGGGRERLGFLLNLSEVESAEQRHPLFFSTLSSILFLTPALGDCCSLSRDYAQHPMITVTFALLYPVRRLILKKIIIKFKNLCTNILKIKKKFRTGYHSSSTASTLLWLYPFMMLLETHAHTHAHPVRVRDGLPHNGVQETNRMKHNDLIVQDKEPYLCPLGYFIHWSRRLKALDEISDSRKTTHYICSFLFYISESNLFKHFKKKEKVPFCKVERFPSGSMASMGRSERIREVKRERTITQQRPCC